MQCAIAAADPATNRTISDAQNAVRQERMSAPVTIKCICYQLQAEAENTCAQVHP
jgi:hypothetical protein